MLKNIFAGLAFGVIAVSASVSEARDYPVTLTYVAPPSVERGAPTISPVIVIDQRPNNDRHWLGAVRSRLGNPHRTLVTEAPVSDVVAIAIRSGLEARNLAAVEAGPHRLVVLMTRFDCNQFMPKEAHVVLLFRLHSAETGDVLYEGTVEAHRVGGPTIFGIAPVEPLLALMNEAMQAAIDQALDDPNFHAALAQGAAGSVEPVAATEAAVEPVAESSSADAPPTDSAPTTP
jgi:hypothetical protein